jgi:hypothetical protein
MRSRSRGEIPVEIERARLGFTRWRKNRKKVTRIPDQLWERSSRGGASSRGKSDSDRNQDLNRGLLVEWTSPSLKTLRLTAGQR